MLLARSLVASSLGWLIIIIKDTLNLPMKTVAAYWQADVWKNNELVLIHEEYAKVGKWPVPFWWWFSLQ